MKRAIAMSSKDNVATALEDFEVGCTAKVTLPSQEVVKEITVMEKIPFGHKLAIAEIKKGEAVIKYGEVIGHASEDIDIGKHVHIHNVKSNRMQLPDVWYRKEG